MWLWIGRILYFLHATGLKHKWEKPVTHFVHIFTICRIKGQMPFFAEDPDTEKSHRYQVDKQICHSRMHQHVMSSHEVLIGGFNVLVDKTSVTTLISQDSPSTISFSFPATFFVLSSLQVTAPAWPSLHLLPSIQGSEAFFSMLNVVCSRKSRCPR